MLMFEGFSCSKFFNFVVVNFITSKNLKILKICDKNRAKICKTSPNEDMKSESLSENL